MPGPPPAYTPWSQQERDKLIRLRVEYSDLSWKQFHKLDLFPDRTDAAVKAMYSRMKLESAETSDSQTDSDGDSGDGDESEAELGAPDKSPRQHGLKKPRSAADSKNSKLLVEYDTTDSETDPKGTSRDRDSRVFDSPTPLARKRKQSRVVPSQSPRPECSRPPTTSFWIQPQQEAMAATGITQDTKPVLQSHIFPPTREYDPRIHFPATWDMDYSADDTQLTLGQHLKEIEMQNADMHKRIEEQIQRLKGELTAAKERSNQAATLLRKLQQVGGLLNLSPSEASTLIDVIKASGFNNAGAPLG